MTITVYKSPHEELAKKIGAEIRQKMDFLSGIEKLSTYMYLLVYEALVIADMGGEKEGLKFIDAFRKDLLVTFKASYRNMKNKKH